MSNDGSMEVGAELLHALSRSSLTFNESFRKAFCLEDEPSDPRDKMALRAAVYALELHRSIATLVHDGQHRPAMALGRLFVESVIAALYLLYAATEDRAKAFLMNRKGLPDAADMAKKCRRIDGSGPDPQAAWEVIGPLHKLTHGDAPLLNWSASEPGNFERLLVFLSMADVLAITAIEVGGLAIDDQSLLKQTRAHRETTANLLTDRLGIARKGPLAKLNPPPRCRPVSQPDLG